MLLPPHKLAKSKGEENNTEEGSDPPHKLVNPYLVRTKDNFVDVRASSEKVKIEIPLL